MKKGLTISTKVTVIVLIIIIVNTASIGIFGYVIHRRDSIKSNSDRIMAIAKAAAMSIIPEEFRQALETGEKSEHYNRLRKQFEQIFAEENLHYFYGGTFDPLAAGEETAMIMYLEGHGDLFGLNGNVRSTIFRDAAREAYINGETRVTEVYSLNVDGVPGIAAYAPIFDESGETIGLIGVIMSLEEAIARSNNFALTMAMISLAIFFALTWIPIVYIRRTVAKPLFSIQTASNKLARGEMDIHVPTRKTNDEVGILSKNFTTMQEIVVGMHQEIKGLVENATNGNLNYRANSEIYPGDWRKVITQFNELMDTIAFPIDEAADALHEIANGNFEIRITSEHKGDFDRIKQAVNTAAFELDRYLTEKERTERDLLNAEQEANRAKSEFLSRMSHEMRTPMNAIIGMTRIAEASDDVSRLKYCIDKINRSSEHLLGIINDILDMSKMESGKYDLETVPVNIEKMLTKVKSIFAGNIEKKNLSLKVFISEGLHLDYMADDLRLSQVLSNLLSNAVKFTPDEGSITFGVNEIERRERSSLLHFYVKDTGIGMTGEQISRLFNVFEQADGSLSRKYGGTGLGLAISKNIAEKMGGRINVNSEPGAGSEFVFEVVLERA